VKALKAEDVLKMNNVKDKNEMIINTTSRSVADSKQVTN